MMRNTILGLLLVAGFALGPQAWGADTDILELRVVNLGHGTLDEESVLAYSSQKIGDAFSRNAVARDVKELQRSGRFAYVGASVERLPGGLALVYEVKEKPPLRRITVKGAEYYRPSKIRKMIDLQPGVLVDDGVIAEHVLPVKKKYRAKNFPYAKVDWVINEDDRTGEADVEILIDEGRRARVGRISIEGAQGIPEKKLRGAMKQRQANLLSWVTKAGTYNPDQVQADLFSLRKLYLDKGFLDVKLGEPRVVPYKKKKVELIIPVEEGFPYYIRSYRIEGNEIFSTQALDQTLNVREGQLASLGDIEASGRALQDYYTSRGYLRTQVRENVDPDPDQRVVDVVYEITEGSLSYIRNINIRGNSRTKDKVIRRELAVYPGEVFDAVRVRRSENRLRNLGYFSTVFSSPSPTPDPDQYDLTFEVDEKKTGQFVVGAGFSSIDNLIGFIELSQGNFDIGNWPHLTGGGQKVKFRAQLGTSRTDLEFSFTEPWFLDRRLSLNFSLFQNERRFLSDEYDQRNTGGSVTLGKSLGGYYRLNLTYRLESIDVFNVSDSATDTIKAEAGARSKSSLSPELVYDSRDNVFITSRGNKTSLRAALAGSFLGGETDIYTLQLRSSQFFPLWFEHVFNLRGWIAGVENYGNSDFVPIFDRLFLGGARTLRGFDFRDVGPRDENGEALGGQSAWYGTAEYTVPIVKVLRGAVFYDIGAVSSEAFKFETAGYNDDWGFGARLDLPAFPLRLDYAWPITADEFNDRSSGRFNFLLGYTF